jgi:hypothetical protein
MGFPMRIENENFGDIAPFGLRMPSKLKERLKNSAKLNKHSLNAEIVKRLERSYFQEDLLFDQMTEPEKTTEYEIKKRLEHHHNEFTEVMMNRLQASEYVKKQLLDHTR